MINFLLFDDIKSYETHTLVRKHFCTPYIECIENIGVNKRMPIFKKTLDFILFVSNNVKLETVKHISQF